MHDGMQYDPIQGQSHHEPFEVGNPAISTAISSAIIYNGSWQLTTNS